MIDDQTVDDIATLEYKLRKAICASDIKTLDEMFDEVLVSTLPDGRVLSKADELSLHREGQARLRDLSAQDIRLYRIDALIMTTAIVYASGQYGTTTFSGKYTYTRLWRPHGSTWRLAAAHGGAHR